MKFSELNLEDSVLQALDAMNFRECTPVQEHTIPVILEGKDLIGVAQTGTGKTAAYLLPVINELSKGGYPADAINCIIMSPTRELAQQIDQQMEGFSYFMPVSSVAIYGGNDGIRFEQEKKGLTLGADVVIATPGRLISHLSLGYVDLSKVSFFILDEADRMLDMGFADDIMQIVKYLPKKRQTIMFSATMPAKIQQLAKTILQNPVEVKLAVSKPAEKIIQAAYICYEAQKLGIIESLFSQQKPERVIIFASSKLKVTHKERTNGQEHVVGQHVKQIEQRIGQRGRDTDSQHKNDGADQGLAATERKAIHQEADDRLPSSNTGGKRGDEKGNVEQGAPHHTAGDGVEHIGHDHKGQAGARLHFKTQRRHHGEDHQAGENGHEDHGTADDHGILGGIQLTFLLIAAEYQRHSHADAQREKGLAQSCQHGLAAELGEIRLEQELHALCRAGLEQAHDRDNDHDHRQRGQQDLGDLFDAGLKVLAYHQRRQHTVDGDHAQHQPEVAGHIHEVVGHFRTGHALEGAQRRCDNVIDDPAIDGNGISGHQNDAQHIEVANNAPLFFAGERLIGCHRCAAGCHTQRDLRREQRHTDDDHKEDIGQQEQSTAVFTADIGKSPQRSHADREPDGGQQESQPGAKGISFFHSAFLSLSALVIRLYHSFLRRKSTTAERKQERNGGATAVLFIMRSRVF